MVLSDDGTHESPAAEPERADDLSTYLSREDDFTLSFVESLLL